MRIHAVHALSVRDMMESARFQLSDQRDLFAPRRAPEQNPLQPTPASQHPLASPNAAACTPPGTATKAPRDPRL